MDPLKRYEDKQQTRQLELLENRRLFLCCLRKGENKEKYENWKNNSTNWGNTDSYRRQDGRKGDYPKLVDGGREACRSEPEAFTKTENTAKLSDRLRSKESGRPFS